MKLTKKDKIMLLVLGLVIVVAVFYVYGIMPANEQVADLDAIIAQKQGEYDAINQKLSSLEIGVYEAKIDKVLEQYFKDKAKAKPMRATMDRIEFEKYMVNLLHGYNASGFSTAPWTTNEINTSVKDPESGVTTTYTYMETNVPLTCDFKTFDDYVRFLEDMRVNNDFVLDKTTYTINKRNVKEDGTTAPEEVYNEVSATFGIKFYTGDQYDSDILPEALADVAPRYGESKDTLVFAPVEHAVSYEAYLVDVKESGYKEFTRINGVSFVKGEDGNMSVKFTANEIKDKDKSHEVFIRAIGDKQKYYKSLMIDTSVGIEVVVG